MAGYTNASSRPGVGRDEGAALLVEAERQRNTMGCVRHNGAVERSCPAPALHEPPVRGGACGDGKWVTCLATATSNQDGDAVRAALAALSPVRDRLDQFVQDNQ